MKLKLLAYLLAFATLFLFSFRVNALDFVQSRQSAAKASLSSDSYYLDFTIAKANFSSDLAYPIQLSYDSSKKSAGLVGYGWSIPQLESSVYFNGSNTIWKTPWGENISFTDGVSDCGDWSIKGSNNSGNWSIWGNYDLEGWTFEYKKSKIIEITSPNGQVLVFDYRKELLRDIKQNGKSFVSLSYKDDLLKEITVNGVSYFLGYDKIEMSLKSKVAKGKDKEIKERFLSTVEQNGVNPLEFSYNKNGYLDEIAQGDFVDELEIDTSSAKAGRILSDNKFKYIYGNGVGDVSLEDKRGNKASFKYNSAKGSFTQKNFAGKSNTIYYFTRYDVAYAGKVRKVIDDEENVLVSYEYDKDSGKVTRIRDRYENDVNFEYDDAGNLTQVSTCDFDEEESTPIRSFKYKEGSKKPYEINDLDAAGEVENTIKLSYDSQNRVTAVDNGERNAKISYNSFGYPESSEDTFGRKSSITYDTYNRVQSTENANGVKTSISYDSAGRRSKIESSYDSEVLDSLSIFYGSAGLPSSIIYGDGTSKSYNRDSYGRVIEEIFADNTSVKYDYDDIGNLAKVTDERGNEILFKWSEYGLESKETAEGQITENHYTKKGNVEKTTSKYAENDFVDKEVKYKYDKYNRITEVDYGNGEIETRDYDNKGRLVQLSKGGVSSTFSYNSKGRLISQRDGDVLNTYTYDKKGRRIGRVTKVGVMKTLEETRDYDKYGRLVKTTSGENFVEYQYNNKNQLERQLIDENTVVFTYTKLGQVESKSLLNKDGKILGELKYDYANNGTIRGRTVNDNYETYTYDARKQLISVNNAITLEAVESYVYDETGNILSKTVRGETTTFTYDKSNQLLTKTTPDGETINYSYDAAGRMTSEGDKTYTYGWADKVLEVGSDKGVLSEFEYYNSGQISNATHYSYIENKKQKRRHKGSQYTQDAITTESFVWDGLALIDRNGTSYINEPHAGGGNPVLAISENGVQTILTDILGTSVGTFDSANGYASIEKSTFGEHSSDTTSFYTGKPHVENLGYVFLMRNYRSDLSKWQTADPIGYPDGWNNFAYCNNMSTLAFDLYGCAAAIDACNDYAYFYCELGNGEIYDEQITNITEWRAFLKELEVISNETTINNLIIVGHGESNEEGGISINQSINFSLSPYQISNAFQYLTGNSTVLLVSCYQGNYLDLYLKSDLVPVGLSITGYTIAIRYFGLFVWEDLIDPWKYFDFWTDVTKVKE